MGRKKKKPLKPWCWYCNREFDDDKILTQHQRAKHYKCPFCHKKLYSGPGLTVHCVQVHKEKLDKIPEALPNRNSVDIDIYGMDGIPEEDLREHERLKRGDDGRSKSEQDSKPQTNKHQNSNQQLSSNNSHSMGLPPNPMQAAMLQHAMSMGMMPPGFPMHPPGGSMSLPPFMPPPGFPGMLPPHMHAGMPPPPMHPGLPIPSMLPGMPPPPLGFPPMLPQTSVGPFPPLSMGFPGMPPPPPPPPSDEPSTSNAQQLPSPMSGAGQLIGVPPPNFKPDALPPPIRPQGAGESSNNDEAKSNRQLTLDNRPEKQYQPANEQTSASKDTEVPGTSSTTTSTIARSAVITNSESTASQYVKNYIEIPSAKARIMHPNSELSLEEIRLSLSRYKSTLQSVGVKKEVVS